MRNELKKLHITTFAGSALICVGAVLVGKSIFDYGTIKNEFEIGQHIMDEIDKNNGGKIGMDFVNGWGRNICVEIECVGD